MKSQQSRQVNNTQGTCCSQNVTDNGTQQRDDSLAESDAKSRIMLEEDSLEEETSGEVSDNKSTCSTRTSERLQIERGRKVSVFIRLKLVLPLWS